MYVTFGYLASLKYGTENVVQRNGEKIQSLKHKMLHLGHFWVMILMMLTDMNAQIHDDNSMFSKRILHQSYHIMKTGIKKRYI